MNRSEMLLVQMMEECDEVSQAVSKQLRFGPNNVFPMQDGTLGNRVVCETIDFLTILAMCQEEGLIPPIGTQQLKDLSALKREKVEKYLVYSRDKGTLHEKEISSD